MLRKPLVQWNASMKGLFLFIGDTVSTKQRRLYTDLALFQQDIAELVNLFQNNLQDVEIAIDDQHIAESTQLEQFDTAYQAKSLLMRGYWPDTTRVGSGALNKYQGVELKINKSVATVSSQDIAKDTELLVQLKKVLLRHQLHIQRVIQQITYWLLFVPALTLISLPRLPHTNFILQLLLEVGIGIVLIPTIFSVCGVIIVWLKWETRVLLFPGRMEITPVYSWSRMIGRLGIALVVVMVCEVGIILTFFAFYALLR